MEFPNFNLLDELITTLLVLFLVVLFLFKFLANNLVYVASDLDRADPDFFCLPMSHKMEAMCKWVKHHTRVLEITSRNLRKRKNL